MVKTPRTRHSRTAKDPVTIDLAPGEVSRIKAEAEKADAAEAEEPGEAAATQEPVAAKADPGKAAETVAKEPDVAEESDREKAAASGGTAAREEPRPSSGPSPSGPASSFGRQEPPRPAPEPAARRGGALAAGVAGGVIALALAGGLQFAGLLPGASAPPAAPDDRASAVAALETQVAELREQVSALGAAGGADEALDGRVAQAEERVASLASELDALREEIAGLGAQPGETPSVDLGPLEDRIAALETAIAGVSDAAAPEAALAAIEGDIATLREEAAAARAGQEAVSVRLDALEQTLSTLSQRVEEQAEAPGTAAIIAASALKAAIDRGTPFMAELETYATLIPDAPEIAELRELAASGVPTRTQVAAEANDAANAMIAAARPVDPEAGIIDRLWGSAMGLVQVRPIGMVEGEGVPQIVARIDAAIAAGDYERAVAEFDTLPEAARAAGEPFMTKVRARHAADRLIDQALAAALKA